MLQKYNFFAFFCMEKEKKLYLCHRIRQSGGCGHRDERESGESPELFLQL